MKMKGRLQMKKDRNAFFQESSYFNQASMPGGMVANQPFITNAQSQQSFYAGPGFKNTGMPNNYNMNMAPIANNIPNNTDYSDIESRLSKIERSLNRIDARLSKLENQGLFTTDDIIDSSTNMYMV